MAELTVRPAPSGFLSSSADIFKVHLSPEYLLRHNLQSGNVCSLSTLHKENSSIGSVIVDKSTDKSLRSSIIQTSQALQALYRLKLGDKVSLTRTKEGLPHAATITFTQVKGVLGDASALSSSDERTHWSWVLQKLFIKTNLIAAGVTFDDVEVCGETRSFTVLEVDTVREPRVFRVDPDCHVIIIDSDDKASIPDELYLEINSSAVGGLDNELVHLNRVISKYGARKCNFNWLNGRPPRTPGVLLHGLSGAGKSFVLGKIAQAGWRQVYNLDGQALSQEQPSQSLATTIKKTFASAERRQPCAVLIDELESIAPSQTIQVGARSAASVIRQEFDRLHNSRVLVVATTRSLADIDQRLRSPHYLSKEIEIPIPSITARAQILKTLNGLPKDVAHPKLDRIATCTHGFVGVDLLKLQNTAAENAEARVEASDDSLLSKSNLEKSGVQIECTVLDYLHALRHVQPTAMREIFVETPQVYWSDICGQNKVKQYLEEAIIWPYKFGDELKEYGIEKTKGLLLYGPPGCSKTMTAKAVATESGLNFMAVKGAELLNMYVGESERAIRELFAKARAVSPSIIFFDEIDAIGSSRDGGQHSGIHTVTTLLNEMDGIDEFKGVFVLAATNRPEVLDTALTRPGRLDNMIYVGPPDEDARTHILEKRSCSMKLDACVDLIHIARLAEGRSGAEIVELCQRAGQLAFRERVKIGQRHFEAAMKEIPKSITPEMERSYREFAANRC